MLADRVAIHAGDGGSSSVDMANLAASLVGDRTSVPSCRNSSANEIDMIHVQSVAQVTSLDVTKQKPDKTQCLILVNNIIS